MKRHERIRADVPDEQELRAAQTRIGELENELYPSREQLRMEELEARLSDAARVLHTVARGLTTEER